MGFLCLAGCVSLVLVSIAASQLLLSAAIPAALLLWQREGRLPRLPGAILWPALFLFVWTVTAVLAGSGRLDDALVRKFLLFSLLLIVPVLARGSEQIAWIYRAVFAVAGVSAVAGLIQFLINPHRDALNRIKGFMSIWMTYSGLLMLVLVALVAFALTCSWKKHPWVAPLGLLLGGALFLSQTRSAWLGAVTGVAVILLLMRPRALLLLAALLFALYLVSPGSIQQRLRSGFNLKDDNTRNRIELLGTAARLIRAHPWIGVGQKVSREALAYRGTHDFPDYLYLHMHNNFLQIAAERGIPGLMLWLWLMIQSGWQAFRVYRSSRDPASDRIVAFVGAAAIGGWVALMVAGMFEYNYGDSEVLTLFLFMVSAPHATRVLSDA
jgi:O-antigen ligase